MKPHLQAGTETGTSAFATNATIDSGSGISGDFQTKIASPGDWGPVTLAGGPDETTLIENSRWKNAFILGQDPNDESKFLYGGDVGAGLVERGKIDIHGVAVLESVFNPMSRNVRQESNERSTHLSLFYVAENGNRLAGIVSNELGLNGVKVSQYTGVVQSENGGATWGWVWKGSTNAGLVQNSGLCVLSSGCIITGTQDATSSIRRIRPGGKIEGKPLFVGYRPSNILGSAEHQSIINDGKGQVQSIGSMPEKPLPSITHSEQGFRLSRLEGSGGGASIKLIDQALDEVELSTQNMNIAYWTRRLTPSSNDESMRMEIETRFGWDAPGSQVDFGSASERFTPYPRITSDDWVRVVSQYNGSHLIGTFAMNPSDLNASVRGLNTVTSSGNSEVFFEYANVGHDRISLPYEHFMDFGVSSSKFESLNLGDQWTILVVMEIPEECWDSWTGNESGVWDERAPVFTVSDYLNSSSVSFMANMVQSAQGGVQSEFLDAQFFWEIQDSDGNLQTQIPAHPTRTSSVIFAISKDGTSKLRYAIGGPSGLSSGTRQMASPIIADTLRFSDIGESDTLEMYILQVQADCRALEVTELESLVLSLIFPQSQGSGCGCVADMNNDGLVNFFDISLFLKAFASEDPVVDFTGDGTFNFFDVTIFLQAFAAGCP